MEIQSVKATETITATRTPFEIVVNGEKVEGALNWDNSGYFWEFEGTPNDLTEEILENEDYFIEAIEAVAVNGSGAK